MVAGSRLWIELAFLLNGREKTKTRLRQKCVNATRDILMSKARKITKKQSPWTPWIKSGLKWPKNYKKCDKNCISKVS